MEYKIDLIVTRLDPNSLVDGRPEETEIYAHTKWLDMNNPDVGYGAWDMIDEMKMAAADKIEEDTEKDDKELTQLQTEDAERREELQVDKAVEGDL